MSSLTVGQFKFFSYSNDHDPPHVDARKGRGKFKIYLAIGSGTPCMGPRKRMSRVDAKRAFKIVCEHHGQMVNLWEKTHGKAKIR